MYTTCIPLSWWWGKASNCRQLVKFAHAAGRCPPPSFGWAKDGAMDGNSCVSLSLCSRHSTRETVREQSVVDSLRTRAHLHSEMDARLCDVVLFLTPHPVPELQCAHTPSRNNEQGARFLTTLTPSLRLHAPPANMHSTRHPLLFSKVPFPRIEPTFPWQK